MRKRFLFCLFFLTSFAFAQEPEAEKLSQIEARLDSLGEYAGSTAIGKDDSPVSVSGDFTVRLKHFEYPETGTMQGNEKMRTLIDAALNATIVVQPASFLTLFANLYLPFDLSGYWVNKQAITPNNDFGSVSGERVPGFHSGDDFYGAAVNENMVAGMDMRGGSFGATLFMGGVIWTAQSPLSVWERETSNRYVSQYELYEEEKVVSLYYKEKGFKPVKEGGRAFWTNRPFGGMLLDVHTLPFNLRGQLVFSQPASVDIAERDGLRLDTRDNSEQAMVGTYDYRGTVIGGRFAKEKIDFGEASLTLGVNYLGILFDKETIYEGTARYYFTKPDSSIRFEDQHVATIDLKGNINPKFFLSFDLAISWDDSTIFRPAANCNSNPLTTSICHNAKDFTSETSAPAFGLYVKAQDKHWQPLTLEVIYLPKDFYAPYAMSNPDRFPSWRQDEFYVGAGTYRYGPNMIGANLKLEPEFSRGRFDVQYGVHKQVEKGEDVIHFKYNLVGRQLWETSSSWTRHKPFFNLDSGNADPTQRYTSRLAGSKVWPRFKLDNQEGGLRSGYAETWDAFVPFSDAQDAFNCSKINFYTTETQNNAPCKMPESVKWNSSIAADMGYDIGHWFNTDRNIMMQLFASLSGVSTSFIPVAYTDKYEDNMLMWSFFAQSEPAVAITPSLHGFLIFGFENFRAQKAYTEYGITMNSTAYAGLYSTMYNVKLSPINIVQTAIGFGFDWDFAQRAGLHFRYKYLTNDDENLPQNNWKAHHIQTETKVWF